MAIRGHCLCGAVRYELDAEPTVLSNCHCQFCRRAHGAAFATTALVPTSALRIVAGEASIQRHQGRFFCRTCGSRLFNRSDSHPQATSLVVTSLAREHEPSLRPAAHLNVESKAPWYEILDAAPQFPGFPPAVEAALRR
jgi:hypothetical protein